MQTIRELRCSCGLTQTQLATRIGAHQAQVSSWERGAFRPRPLYLYKLAQVFGVRMDEIEVAGPERRPRNTATGAPNETAPAVNRAQQSGEDFNDPNR